MFGFGKPKPVKETEATGEIERVYHEIKMTMRVSGVNLNFRIWAYFDKFFPAMWDAMRPNAETRNFETAADLVRAEAVRSAANSGALDTPKNELVGESEAYQIQAALDLYHYINPKLLVYTSAVLLALEGEQIGRAGNASNTELIERGTPARMFPMEMMPEKPDDKQLQAIFDDIIDTYDLSSINSDYRTLGLWAGYLDAAWARLKPISQTAEYETAVNNLRETAIEQARRLPFPVMISKEQVENSGEDYNLIVKTTGEFERLLAPLIINIALFQLDWKPSETLVNSPFPAISRDNQIRAFGGTGL